MNDTSTRLMIRTVFLFTFYVFLIVFVPGVPSVDAGLGPETDSQRANQATSFDDMPHGLAPALATALQKDLPAAYRLSKSGDGFRSKNPAHGMQFVFAPAGVKVQAADKSWRWGMALNRWGREGALRTVPTADPVANKGRLTYRRGADLTEWYLNTHWGLEQGFTINQRPSGRRDQSVPVILELTLSGTLHPELKGNALVWIDDTGRPLSRYAGLHVYDAEKQPLPARLTLANNRLRILVDDTDARYPIVVDPWIQQAKLTHFPTAGADLFGSSVAIEGDTVVVGAEGYGFGGRAYIFEKPPGGWADMNQTAQLDANDNEAGDSFGASVAISGDTVVVGAPRHDVSGEDDNQGVAYVFVKAPTGWAAATQTKLTASDGAAEDYFGQSVSVSDITVVVGTEWHDTGGNADQGAAYVFVRPAGAWVDMTETAKLTAVDGAANDRFGRSVAAAVDAVVVGAYYHDTGGETDQGAAYIFVEPAGGWVDMTQTAKLTTSDGGSFLAFGYSVAFESDTIVVAPRKSPAYVFVRPAGGWTDMTQTARLKQSDAGDTDYFGESVAISGDTIVVGADFADIGANINQGAAYIFEKPLYGWSDMVQTDKLIASDGAADDYFGNAVAISGETVVVGAYFDDVDTTINRGSAYVFEMGGANEGLAVDFGGYGLWHYNGFWSKKTNWNPDDDLAGWSGGLGVDFNTDGIWNLNGSWSSLAKWDAGAGGLAGWTGGLAVDFDGNGLWNFDGTSWIKKTDWDVDDEMAAWGSGLGIDFGTNGLWNYNGFAWERLTTWDTGSAGLTGWNGGLAADFDTIGLWSFDGSAWRRLTNWDPEDDLTGWPGGLAVDFGANGLWGYNGSSWRMLTPWDPGVMTGFADGLAVDFGVNGMWIYNGSSWSKLTNWAAENMEDVNLD